jgi:hypothetical protein
MVRRWAMRAGAAGAVSIAVAGLLPGTAGAEAPSVFPGMEIRQDSKLCTLGYVDAGRRIAYTAGHCRGGGVVTDWANNVIGHMATFRDNTPTGTTVATDQMIADYEAIVLADNVAVSNVLPGGRRLEARGASVAPGQPICHFGVATGETCGTVESVNNGWFTMSHGVVSQKGDSGGPVYVSNGGSAQLVGIFNSVWGDLPAAVSWRNISEQANADLAGAG